MLHRQELEVMSINSSKDWKFGLITYDLEKLNENSFVLSDTSNGWKQAELTKQELFDVVEGKRDILTLNWE